MILLLNFAIEQAVIFYQQDTICYIKLSNSGQSAISLPLMDMDASFPIMYVCNTNTGQENIYRGRPSPHIKSAPMMLAPGEEIEDQFSLLSKIPNMIPGEYEISIGWEFNKTETARSNTIQIKILPSTPARLNLVNLIGGQSDNKLGAWIDLANDPHQLLYGGFNLNIGGGVSILKNIIPSKELIRPVFSAPVNQAPLLSKTIAWSSQKELNYVYFDEDTAKIKPKSLKLSSTDAEIIEPLYSINALEKGVLQDSVVLIYTGLSSATKFQVQTIRLSAKKANVIGQADLPGPKPLWIANHARSEQNLLMTYVQADDLTLTLHSAPWPGITSEFSRSTRLADFKGRFLAADAVMASDCVIYGGILMWKHLEDGTSKLVLLPWTLDEKNQFETQPEHAIDWKPADLIKTAIMKISDGGRPVALFTDVEETWHIYDGKGKILPMPAPYQKTKQLIEIGFINGIGDPLLICGTIHNGFKIIQLDGSPIPPRMTK